MKFVRQNVETMKFATRRGTMENVLESTKNFYKKMKEKKLHGFTLVEIMVTLLIIGILTAIFLRSTTSSVSSAKTTAVVQDVTTLMGVAHAYGGNTAGQLGGTYLGLSSMVSGGYSSAPSLLPKSYTTSGMQNAFGGFGLLSTASNPYQYQITETGIPVDACTEIMAKLSSLSVTATCNGGSLVVIGQ